MTYLKGNVKLQTYLMFFHKIQSCGNGGVFYYISQRGALLDKDNNFRSLFYQDDNGQKFDYLNSTPKLTR